MRKCFWFLVILIFATTLTIAALAQESTPSDEQALFSRLTQAGQYYNGVSAYQARINLNERFGDKLRGVERIFCNYTKKPTRIYVLWEPGGVFAGLQASYVEPRDGPDHIQALQAGALGLIGVKSWHLEGTAIRTLYPHHFLAKNYNMGFLINFINDDLKSAKSKGMLVVKSKGPVKHPNFKNPLDTYHATLSGNPIPGKKYNSCILGFDTKSSLPRFVETYNPEGKLHSQYAFVQFKPINTVDDSIFVLKKLEN